ncbi:uncharacterized protein BO88DRAFT_400800 [Aspergillus vadensis CBS 113365]|uniref:Uncharacterized protein n=1 Tax=Aspergillus vadensis (strain CBS 113365 / IMI 142717 / IBT 24658) TaxID=1448311 RepID=A0A319BRT8_ASPVC|nr:hypothetical protein BO88DRAFT_400800 [Aspergillus vadensis CBS 113365]PYH75234.1 hypothetical protein BO88DRAFT_400800 [Aspergillus vadensis CBS 113365]
MPKIQSSGREWMIVTNGSPSGTPGNNPDLNSEPASYLIQEQCCLVSPNSHPFCIYCICMKVGKPCSVQIDQESR